MRIGHKIEPGRELNVRRNKIVDPLLQIADAAADLKSRSRNGTAGYPVENVIIDRPQNRLPLPNRTIVVKNTGHV